MFAAVKKVNDAEDLIYVNVTLVTSVEPGTMHKAKFDGDREWPTCRIYFGKGDQRHIFGNPQQVLASWFGPPANTKGEEKKEEPNRIVVPSMVPPANVGR